MIMMGNRSGHQDDVKIIDYVTRKDIREKYDDGKVRIRNNKADAAAR